MTPDDPARFEGVIFFMLDPREELKDKLDKCGYPYTIEEVPAGLMMATHVKFQLPKGNLSISIKQAQRRPMADIKALINAAMNQEEIIRNAPNIADHQNEME